MRLTPFELAQFARERTDYLGIVRHARHSARANAVEGIELTCIGNAGGTDAMVHGRPAGGLLLRTGATAVIVDPGQNSLALLARFGFNPHDLTHVLASHAHNDHVGDLSAAVAAALQLGFGEPGPCRIVVCPSLIDYESGVSTRFGFTVPAYAWRGDVRSLYWEPMTVKRFDGQLVRSDSTVELSDGIVVSAAEGRHGQVKVTGFVLDTPFGRVGYTSDTEWFAGLAEAYRNVDVLWMNMNTLALDTINDVGRARTAGDNEPVHNHLGYVGVCRLIDEVRPKTAAVSHLGAQLLERRRDVEQLLRARFADREMTIVCPDNGDTLVFERRLDLPPLCRPFNP